MTDRIRRALPVLAGVLLFGGALEVLRLELHAVTWRELSRDVTGIPPLRLGLAVLLTALNYALLTGYDFLAFVSIGKRLPRARVAGAALLAYAISNNVGFAALSGASVRYRFYSRWGVTWEELSRLVFSYSITFWLGLFALGGVSLAVTSLPDAHGLPAAAVAHGVGWGLVLVVAAFLAAAAVWREPLRIRSLAFGRYVVFFEPLPDGIDVVRVLHGSRDIDAMFTL